MISCQLAERLDDAPDTPTELPGSSGSVGEVLGVKALLQSPEVRKKGPVLRMGQVTGQWKEGILVLTRSGFLHWCHEQEVNGHSHKPRADDDFARHHISFAGLESEAVYCVSSKNAPPTFLVRVR